MEIKIDTIEEFHNSLLKYDIPQIVILDIKSRLLDHLLSGGDLEDPYVKQQFTFLENYINNYIDNESESICKLCQHYTYSSYSEDGFVNIVEEGCEHPYLYNKDGDIIETRREKIISNISMNKCDKFEKK